MAEMLVVNERYFPENELEPAHVGATSFSRSALHCLRNAGLSAGVILCKRDEELTEPQVALAHRSTDALLGFHPQELACCVTHHGPFVHDSVGMFSAFKNVELLISGCVQARKRGVPLRILVAGDSPDDGVAQKALRARVPREHRAEFLAVGKLSKAHLYALFSLARPNGIVCSSRYETLGITPLEAALSGVCTLMPDTAEISEENFERDTLSAWTHFSRVARQADR